MSTPEDELESRLRTIAGEVDAPPTHVVEAARAAFALRDLDAELAALVADSAIDAPAVLTRAVVADVRMLSFECGSVTVELDVETDPVTHELTLSGLAIGAVGDVVVVRTDSRATAALSADGRFRAAAVAPGPLRLELTAADGRRVTTSWVTV